MGKYEHIWAHMHTHMNTFRYIWDHMGTCTLFWAPINKSESLMYDPFSFVSSYAKHREEALNIGVGFL